MKAKRLIALLLAGVMVLGNATTAYAESESASMTSEFAGNVIQSDDKTDTASVEGGETEESQDSKNQNPEDQGTDASEGEKKDTPTGVEETGDAENSTGQEDVKAEDAASGDQPAEGNAEENAGDTSGDEETLVTMTDVSDLVVPYFERQEYGESGISLLADGVWTGDYGSQVTDEQMTKDLYNAMVEGFVKGSATVKVQTAFTSAVTFEAEIGQDANGNNVIVENESYKAARDNVFAAFYKAFQAFVYDYPEAFWISGMRIGISISAVGSAGQISNVELTVGKYYEAYTATGATEEEKQTQIADQVTARKSSYKEAVTNAANEIRAKAGADASRMQLARAVHDYLCDTLSYDDEAAEAGTDAYLYAHTSSTVFIGTMSDSTKRTVVCEGYAKAFKVLCDELGIPAILVTGFGVDTSGNQEAHMWNYVQMDDEKWYVVDATWDDQGTAHGTQNTRYEYFLAGSTSTVFNGKTFSEDHLTQEIEALGDGGDAVYTFVYPPLQESTYSYNAKAVLVFDSSTNRATRYDTLSEAADYIQKGEADARYEVTLQADLSVSATALGFDNVSVDLNGHTLTILDGAVLRANISGGTLKFEDGATVTFGTGEWQTLSDIAWSGAPAVIVSGRLNVSGDLTMSSLLFESGSLKAENLTVSGNLTTKGLAEFYVQKKASFQNVNAGHTDQFRIVKGNDSSYTVSGTISGLITFARENDGETADFADGEVLANVNGLAEDAQINLEYTDQLSVIPRAVKKDSGELVAKCNFKVELYERKDYVNVGNGYDTLEEAAAAMEDGKSYRISVNDDVSASGDILNRIGSVLELNGHTLTLADRSVFAMDATLGTITTAGGSVTLGEDDHDLTLSNVIWNGNAELTVKGRIAGNVSMQLPSLKLYDFATLKVRTLTVEGNTEIPGTSELHVIQSGTLSSISQTHEGACNLSLVLETSDFAINGSVAENTKLTFAKEVEGQPVNYDDKEKVAQLNSGITLQQISVEGYGDVSVRPILGTDYALTVRCITTDHVIEIWAKDDSVTSHEAPVLIGAVDRFDSVLDCIEEAEAEAGADSNMLYYVDVKEDCTIYEDDLNFPTSIAPKVSVNIGLHTLTSMAAENVINVTVSGDEGTNGCIRMPYGQELYLIAPSSEIELSNIDLDFMNRWVSLRIGQEFSLAQKLSNEVVLTQVNLVRSTYVTASVYGNAFISGDLPVYQATINTLVVNDEEISQRVHIDGTLSTAGNLNLQGRLEAEYVTVGGTLSTTSVSSLHVYRKATVTGLAVTGVQDKSGQDSFDVYLSEIKNEGTLASFEIRGAASRTGTMEYLVRFHKEITKYFPADEYGDGESDPAYYKYLEDGKFTIKDEIATVIYPEAYIPTGWFGLGDQEEAEDLCIVRNGNTLKVSKALIFVSYTALGGAVKDIHRKYVSFEAAISGISRPVNQNGFGGMFGQYEILVNTDDTLNYHVVVPACVTSLKLGGTGSLDLKNYTITAYASSMDLENGFSLKNGYLTDYSLTNMNVEAMNLEDNDETETEDSLVNVTVTAPSAAVILNESNASYDFGNTVLNVLSLKAESSLKLKSMILYGERSVIYGGLTLDTLTMYSSSLQISRGAELHAGQIWVYSASPMDANEEYRTISNNGGIVQVQSLYMAAGIFYNGSGYSELENKVYNGSVKIQNVQLIINLVNDTDTEFSVESYSQAYYGTTQMAAGSTFGTYGSGTVILYNPTLTGSCILKKEKTTNLNIYGTVTNNDPENTKCTVTVLDENGTPVEELEENFVLFTVSDSAFPVDGFEMTQSSVDGTRYALVQSGGQILVKRARFQLLQLGTRRADGNRDERELGVFATWQQSVDNINQKYNTAADYLIRVYGDVNIEAALNIPVYAKNLEVESGSETKQYELTYYGDLVLNTNVTFRNLKLNALTFNYATWKYDLPYQSGVALYTRELILDHVETAFNYVSGYGGSALRVYNADQPLKVAQYVSGVNNLELDGSEEKKAELQVGGNVSVTNLIMKHGWLNGNGQVVLTSVQSDSNDNKISYGGNMAYNTFYLYGDVTGNTESTVGENYKTNAVIIEPKSLAGDYSANPWIMVAYKASSMWFVTEQEQGKTATSKTGVHIFPIAINDVLLYMGTDDKEQIYSKYATVQEALTQIQTLADPQQTYRVVINSDTATNYYQNLGFPTLAKKLVLEAGTCDVLHFWSQIAIGCDTELKDLQLHTTYGALYPGYYELYLNNTKVQEGSQVTSIAGAIYASKVRINMEKGEAFHVEGNVSNIRTLTIENGTLTTSRWGAVIADTLVLGKEGETDKSSNVTAGYYINVTNIENHARDNTVTCSEQLNSYNHIIYGATPLLTINGNVTGEPVTVCMTDGEKVIPFADTADGYTWGPAYKAGNEYKGILIANARYVSPGKLVLASDNNPSGFGMLYKTNGYVAYISTKEYAIDLRYETDGEKVNVPCLTWTDAITEINNQYYQKYQPKEYEIILKNDVGADGVPTAFTMPASGFASSLTVESEGWEYAGNKSINYYGNIVSYTKLTLNHVDLTQQVYSGGKWIDADDSSLQPNHPAPVYVTTVADLTVGENVHFNTPVYMNGVGVSSVHFTQGLSTYGGREEDTVNAPTANVIHGSVVGYVNVESEDDLIIDTYPIYYWWAGDTYVEGSLSAQNITVNGADLNVATSIYASNLLKVTCNATTPAVKVSSKSITVLDLSMDSGVGTVAVSSDGTFTVQRNITSKGANNQLDTMRNPYTKVPYLYIAGQVTTDAPIQVGLTQLPDEDPIILQSMPNYIEGILLTAPQATAKDFAVDMSNLKDGNHERYEWNADEDVKSGYILQKLQGAYINVYYADEITAGVAIGDASDGNVNDDHLVGYYTSLADAVAAVNTQPNKNQEYTIILMKNVGEQAAEGEPVTYPVVFTLPYNIARVNLVSEQGQNYTIHYMNHVSLASPLRMERITLDPVYYNYTPAPWNLFTGYIKLELEDVSLAEGRSLGYLHGYGEIDITGGEVKVSGYLNANTVVLGEDTGVTCTGSVAIPNLELETDARLSGAGSMAIGNIKINGERAILETARSYYDGTLLNIYGNVSHGEGVSDATKLELLIDGYNGAEITESNYQLSKNIEGVYYYDYWLTVPATKRLADMAKEYTSYFDVRFSGDVAVAKEGRIVKYAAGLYCIDETLQDNEVKLLHDDTNEFSYCLDLAQASLETSYLAIPTEGYTLELSGNIADTNVTDSAKYSAWVFPAANTAEHVTIRGMKEEAASQLTFWSAYGMTCYGKATLENLELNPVDYYGNGNQYLTVSLPSGYSYVNAKWDSQVVFDHVNLTEGNRYYNVVGGNLTNLTLTESDMDIVNVIQGIPEFTIDRSHVKTAGTAVMTNVNMRDSVDADTSWDACSYAYVYGNLTADLLNASSYLATRQYGTSLFNLSGEVKDADAEHPILVKVMDNSEDGYLTDDAVEDVALLNAVKADAGAFKVYELKNVKDIVSYKDIYYSVKNGKLSDMAVCITSNENGSNQSRGQMYAKTFTQAVNMVNQAGVGKSQTEFTMTLLRGAEETNGIEYLKPDGYYLSLPTYAKKVTIQGAEDKEIGIRYAGVITAPCETEFKNLYLDEGYQSWNGWVSHAPTVNQGGYGSRITLPEEVTSYSAIYAPYGTIILPNTEVTDNAYLYANNLLLSNKLTVKGVISANNVSVIDESAELAGESTMTLGNLQSASESKERTLQLTTRRTGIWYKGQPSYSQLTITGLIDNNLGVDILMQVYDLDQQEWRAVQKADILQMEQTSESLPTTTSAVATLVKGSSGNLGIKYATPTGIVKDDRIRCWKNWQAVYMTEQELPIEVTAADSEDGFRSEYMTWDQMAYDINLRGEWNTEYTVILRDDIGENGKLYSLGMPVYAKKLRITSDNKDGNVIFFTYPAISLGCNTEFDHVGLVALQAVWTGRGYQYTDASYSLYAANYELTEQNMLTGGSYSYTYGNSEKCEWLNSRPGTIYGAGHGTFNYQQQTTEEYEKEDLMDVIGTYVTGFGTFDVQANTNMDDVLPAVLKVNGPVTGITNMMLEDQAELHVSNSVSVYNADLNGTLKAWNYTSTGMTSMNHAVIDTSAYLRNQASGVIYLVNLDLKGGSNELNSRLNVYSQPQVSIYGTVTDHRNGSESNTSSQVTFGFRYYNKDRWAQLYDQMVMFTAPYVTAEQANVYFAPRFDRTGEAGMGTETGYTFGKNGWSVFYQAQQ